MVCSITQATIKTASVLSIKLNYCTRKVLFWRCDFFACISWEPLINGFAPNSEGRRVWSLALTSLKIKVKG